MKKLFLLLTLSLLFFNVTFAIGAENCEKQSSVFTDGKGNNRTKKLGGNYAGIALASLNEKQTIKINPVSGTFKYVTLHARYKGGYWKTIYKGANRSFPVATVLSSYIKDKDCTHVNISVNGSYEKYEPIPCKAEVLVCEKTENRQPPGCSTFATVYTDGTGDRRTKKLGGNYTSISLASLNEKQTIIINPVSGTFKYVTLHARYLGGIWEKIYKGTNRSFPVATVLSSYIKNKDYNHVIISVNGSFEKYDYIPCKAEVLVCGAGTSVSKPGKNLAKGKPVKQSSTGSGCSTFATVYTDGTGDRRTKKLGGNYTSISLASLNEKQTIIINPVSGTFKYVTLHARYLGGVWEKIYKGTNRSFPVATVLSSYIKNKDYNHVIISVNGSYEKYDHIPCKAEVLVCGAGTPVSKPGKNLAKGKPVKQSSTGFGADAKRAVDGNTDGAFGANSTTHTNLEQKAWWEVDLQSAYALQAVNAYNRTDCCGERLDGFQVIVSTQPFPNRPLNAQEIKGLQHRTVKQAGNVSRIALGNALGRYVRIQLMGTNYLALAEVEVLSGKAAPPMIIAKKNSKEFLPKAIVKKNSKEFPPKAIAKNVSKGKPVKQSSTGFGGDAKLAVDGNTDGVFGANSTTHTESQQKAWWEVDLQSAYALQAVNVYNRTDCCGERLDGFQVIVSTQPFPNRPLNAQEIKGLQHRTVKQAGNVSRIALGNALGRYVRIQLMGTNYLALAEVEVLGGKAAPPMINVKKNSKEFPPKAIAKKNSKAFPSKAIVKNVSKGKPVKQSSTGFGGDAKLAVDGNTDGVYGANSTTHTESQQKAWWEVDLQSAYALQTVNVYNRTDCCGERLDGFQVIVSMQPFPNRPLNDGEVNGLNHWTVNAAGKVHRINLNNTLGRYMRVQLKGHNYLSLAEVQVFGK